MLSLIYKPIFLSVISVVFFSIINASENQPLITSEDSEKEEFANDIIDSLKLKIKDQSDTLKKLQLMYEVGRYSEIANGNLQSLQALSRVYSSLRTKKELKFQAGRMIRDVYFKLGDYNRSINYHRRLDWSQGSDWEASVPKYFLSQVSYQLGDVEKSIQILKECITIMQTQENQYWELSFSNSVGAMYKDIGNLDSAWHYFTKAKSIFDEQLSDSSFAKNNFIEGLILGNMAQVLSLNGEHLKAIPLYRIDIENSLNQLNENGKRRNALVSLLELINSLIQTGQIEEARSQLDRAEQNLLLVNSHDLWLKYWQLKRALFLSIEDYESAVIAFEKELSHRDSLEKMTDQNSLLDLKALYSIDSENQIKSETDLQIRNLQKEITQNEWSLRLSFILSLLLIGMVLILFWSNRTASKKLNYKSEESTFEVEMNKALAEKDMLLREVHHRVKNNLQIISSLFFLQSKHIKDEVALDLIREGQSRIQVMSLIHQKLYQAEELNQINFQEYISDLAKQILQMHQSNEVEIDITIDAQQITDSLEIAVPIGMILNELLTNSIKHAFTGRRVGHIHIALIEMQEHMKFSYEDDGIGLSETNEFVEDDSLGMKLIRLLAQQLGGAVEFSDSDGFGMSIEFDPN